MLARVLDERGHEVFWASFKKQYPRFLFPGTEQEGETAPWLDHAQQPALRALVAVELVAHQQRPEAGGARGGGHQVLDPVFCPGFLRR